MATEQLRWGVSPLCWTNDVLEDLGGDIPLDTCLREAREAGYQGIELGRKFPRQAETLGPLLAAADLRLASGWYSGLLAERSVEAELEAVREHAQLLRQLGANTSGLQGAARTLNLTREVGHSQAGDGRADLRQRCAGQLRDRLHLGTGAGGVNLQ